MPEYLAPGVYVEEVSFRSKSIEGVSTTTTGFVGPTRYGPVEVEPEVITSLAQYERIFGDSQQLRFGSDDPAARPQAPMHNYMWHAVRAFFEEGGKRLYVARAFRAIWGLKTWIRPTHSMTATPSIGSRRTTAVAIRRFSELRVRARHPGQAGRMRVRLTLAAVGKHSQQRAGARSPPDEPGVAHDRKGAARKRCRLDQRYQLATEPPGNAHRPVLSRRAGGRSHERGADLAIRRRDRLIGPHRRGGSGTRPEQPRATLPPARNRRASRADPDRHDVAARERDRAAGLGRPGARSRSQARGRARFRIREIRRRSRKPCAAAPHPDRLRARDSAATVCRSSMTASSFSICSCGQIRTSRLRSTIPVSTDASRSIELLLDGGNDGQRPEAAQYEGRADLDSRVSTGLRGFEAIEDISIVAAPGSTFGYENGYRANARDNSQSPHLARRADALPNRGARQRREPNSRRRACDAGPARFEIRRVLLSVGPHSRPGYAPGNPSAAERVCRRHLRAQRRQSRGLQSAGERSRKPRDRVRAVAEQRAAGGAQSGGDQLLSLFRRDAVSGSGARARSAPIRSGNMSTCAATSPISSARSTKARSGRFSSRMASALGKCAAHDRGFSAQRIPVRGAARRQAGKGVFRQV